MTDTTGTTATTGSQSSTSETANTASTEGQSTTQASGSTTEGQSTQTGAADTGTTTTTTDTPWQDGLEGDLKTNPLFRDYKTVDELAKAHAHLTKLKGAKANELLKIPAKPRDQDPEAWTAFDAARGVPADPKDYQIELAPEAAADTPELANVLRELGGKAKFDPLQMNAVIETLNDLGKKAAEADTAALNAQTAEVTETLKKEWGAAFEGNQRGIGKLIRDALGGQIDDAAMADLQTQIGSNLTVSRVLAHALGKMAEPEAPEGEGQRAISNKSLTPAAASAALNAFHADPQKMAALNDKKHAQHAAVIEERRALLAMQRGDARPDQAKS